VTFSAGVISSDESTDATQLLELADKALYEAKHSGRNQVASAKSILDKAGKQA